MMHLVKSSIVLELGYPREGGVMGATVAIGEVSSLTNEELITSGRARLNVASNGVTQTTN